MDTSSKLMIAGLLMFAAHLFAALFSRTRIPDVLWLMLVGLIAGPFTGWILPTDVADAGLLLSAVTLVILLFEGGLELRIADLRGSLGTTAGLIAANFIATMLVAGMLFFLLTDLSPLSCIALAGILGGTSSAAVLPIVRRIGMTPRAGTVLILESALSDVLTVVVPMAVLTAIATGEVRAVRMAGGTFAAMVLSLMVGVGGAVAWSLALGAVRRLQNAILTTPACVFVLYGIAEHLGYNGAIAALAFGVTLGNADALPLIRIPGVRSARPKALTSVEKLFFGEAVFLLKTFFFVYIGVAIPLGDPLVVGIGAVITAALFVARLPVIRMTVDRSVPVRDASLMGVMIPKGLAAAAMASLPIQMGLPGGDMMRDLTFAVVMFSMLGSSLAVFALEATPLGAVSARLYADFGRTARRR